MTSRISKILWRQYHIFSLTYHSFQQTVDFLVQISPLPYPICLQILIKKITIGQTFLHLAPCNDQGCNNSTQLRNKQIIQIVIPELNTQLLTISFFIHIQPIFPIFPNLFWVIKTPQSLLKMLDTGGKITVTIANKLMLSKMRAI